MKPETTLHRQTFNCLNYKNKANIRLVEVPNKLRLLELTQHIRDVIKHIGLILYTYLL